MSGNFDKLRSSLTPGDREAFADLGRADDLHRADDLGQGLSQAVDDLGALLRRHGFVFERAELTDLVADALFPFLEKKAEPRDDEEAES